MNKPSSLTTNNNNAHVENMNGLYFLLYKVQKYIFQYSNIPIFQYPHNGKYNLFENRLFEFDFRESKKGHFFVLFSFLGKINYIKSTKWLMLCLHLPTILKTQKKCCITFLKKMFRTNNLKICRYSIY